MPGNLNEGSNMQNDHIDRVDLHRMADDGCPNVPDRDTHSFEINTRWDALGNDDQGAG